MALKKCRLSRTTENGKIEIDFVLPEIHIIEGKTVVIIHNPPDKDVDHFVWTIHEYIEN